MAAATMITLAICFAAASSGPAREGSTPKYKFMLDIQRLVGIGKEDGVLIGKLDREGEFHQMRRIEFQVLPLGDETPPLKVFFYRGPGYEMLNGFSSTPHKVYELRTGMLIPGTIQAWGNFIPEEGGKIVKFSEYRHSPLARQIWNLPGRFEPVKK